MAVRESIDAAPGTAAAGTTATTEGATSTPGTTATIEVDLGARIRALRLARRATLRQLAAQAAVTESFLSQVERGVASPSIASVQRIARALDLTIGQLFAEEPNVGKLVRR